MSQLEAWIVTLLGMGVVFIGLVLCIAFINFFGRLAKKITWDGAHSAPAAPVEPEPEVAAAPAAGEAPVVDAEILAVIAAALEIERRLYLGRMGQRLTLRRTDA